MAGSENESRTEGSSGEFVDPSGLRRHGSSVSRRKKLENAGFTDEQSRAILDTILDVIGDTFATKADLELALAKQKTDIVTWVAGLNLASVALIIGILALLK